MRYRTGRWEIWCPLHSTTYRTSILVMALCNQPKAFTSHLSDDQSRYLSRNGWATAKNLLKSTVRRRFLKSLTDDAAIVESISVKVTRLKIAELTWSLCHRQATSYYIFAKLWTIFIKVSIVCIRKCTLFYYYKLFHVQYIFFASSYLISGQNSSSIHTSSSVQPCTQLLPTNGSFRASRDVWRHFSSGRQRQKECKQRISQCSLRSIYWHLHGKGKHDSLYVRYLII